MTRLSQKVTLRDVLEISRERVEPSAYPDRIFNYVGLENIEGHTGRLLAFEPTAGREIKSTKNIFRPGEILYGKLRPYLNKVYLADEEGICSTDIFVLDVNSALASSSYVAYFLRSSIVLDRVGKLMAGANLPRLAQDGLLETSIPLPPLPEQQRLVRILDEADALRQLRARADTRTNDFIPALFNEMFGDPATNPKGWKVVATQELFAKDRAGTKCGPFGSALKKYEYVEKGIPVWGIDNVLPNEFVEEGSLFITWEKFQQLGSYAVDPGDILISRAGTVGRMCVALPKQSPSIIGSNLIRLSFDQNQIVPEYFTTLFTCSPQATSRFRANSDGGAYSFMNTGTIRNLRIPLPPLALQRAFAARVADVRALQAQQARSRQRLEDLFQALLHRAFAGLL